MPKKVEKIVLSEHHMNSGAFDAYYSICILLLQASKGGKDEKRE
ncbi:hypothetical protein C5S36_05025 [Candidatus Methanophagaceae archaeon]|nr:hypothetical protein C5S36_05025 [Methanophagales archaeon]